MGANTSKTSTKITNDILTEVVQKNLQSSSQDVTNSYGANATNTLKIGNVDGDCNMTQANKADIKQTFKGTMNTKQTNQMSNELESKLKQSYKERIDQANGLTFGSANISVSDTDIENAIKTSVSGEFISNTIQTVTNSMFVLVENTIDIMMNLNCEKGSEITQTNEIIANQVANAVIKSIQENITTNEVLSKIDSSVDKALKQKNDVMGGLIALGVIIGLVLVVILIFKLSGGGGGKTNMMKNQFNNLSVSQRGNVYRRLFENRYGVK